MIDVIGWTGGVLVLAAYFLVSLNKVKSDSLSFQLMNLAGAFLLIINTIYLKAYPSAFVNVVWVGIGAVSLWKIFSKRHTDKAS